MSAVGDWRMRLQETVWYAEGWRRHDAQEPRDAGVLTGDAREAFLLGWDDARDDMTARPGEP